MVFKNHYNHRDVKSPGEKNTGVSMTIPEQAMTIKEIVSRYASGLPVSGARVPIYTGEDDDMPDLEHMDLADREAALIEAKERLDEIKSKLSAKAKAAAAAAAVKLTEPAKQAEPEPVNKQSGPTA